MLGAIIGDIVGLRFEWHNIISTPNAISIGGNSDTNAAVADSIAEVYYGIPTNIRAQAILYLDAIEIDILNRFEEKYGTIRKEEAKKDIL